MAYPDTLTQVIDRLKGQGYTEDRNRHDNNARWPVPDRVGRTSSYWPVKAILPLIPGLTRAWVRWWP